MLLIIFIILFFIIMPLLTASIFLMIIEPILKMYQFKNDRSEWFYYRGELINGIVSMSIVITLCLLFAISTYIGGRL